MDINGKFSPYADWCRNLWESIKLGGYWGIPRSGLIFQKEPDGLNLVEVPKHVGPKQLGDFQATKEHFACANLLITDRRNLLGNQ